VKPQETKKRRLLLVAPFEKNYALIISTMGVNILMPPFLSDVIGMAMDPDATMLEMLQLVLYFAGFWAIVFYVGTILIRPLVFGKAWLVTAGERFYVRGGKEEYEMLGFPTKKEDFINTFMTNWPWSIIVAVQHLVGGLLTVPSLCGIWQANGVASSLACLGVLSEMGWELEDTLVWLYKRYFTKGGKEKVSGTFLGVLMFHHSLSTVLGLPAILYYRESRILHWLCFDLQLAGATTLLAIEYTKLLDVSKPNELFQFQVINFLLVLIVAWTRAIHWIYLVLSFCYVWYQDKAWCFLAIGGTVSLLFTIFNIFCCLLPIYDRWRKFANKTAEYKALPSDIDEGSRRMSIMVLQKAANDVLMDFSLEREVIEMFGMAPTSTERRHTMPPQRTSGRRTSAAILLRASMADVSSILKKME